MDKNPQIKKLTDYFLDKYGTTNIILTNYWDADDTAIGLTDKTKQFTIYISTYKQIEDKFFVSLENPPTTIDLSYTQAAEFDNLTADEVEKLLVTHLNLV